MEFHRQIVEALTHRGAEVITSPFCRLKPEFVDAISAFENADVDAIVTLHLAYSPSLESADVLSATKLPIVVLDTTPDFDFSHRQDPDAIMYNHGIHGVQDMCNLLIRRGKSFEIEAGHWQESEVLDRVLDRARAHRLAKAMRGARIGRMGESFDGMGDFSVPEYVLADKIGATVVQFDLSMTADLLLAESDSAVIEELERDANAFEIDAGSAEAHLRSVRTGLAVRQWIRNESLTGFTFNFLAFDTNFGMPTVPFLEASKSMARGIGYAGEGDVLTSALVGALASVYPGTTFTEAFCPDWRNGSIFLSHMGEINTNLVAGKPILSVKPFAWTDVEDPAVACGRLKGGSGCLANLAPGPDDSFSLIIVPGEMLEVVDEDRMGKTIHGWLRPNMALTEYLAAYSQVGGTHHSAFTYGITVPVLEDFAKAMGWHSVVLDSGMG